MKRSTTTYYRFQLNIGVTLLLLVVLDVILCEDMSQAFNSVIMSPRLKPVVTMHEEIRVYLMEKWETNR